MKELDVMDKAIIKQHYREKFLSDFVWYERGKYTMVEYTDIIKRNINELCDEIQGYDTSKQRKKLCTLSGVCEYRTDDGCDKDGFCNFQMEK